MAFIIATRTPDCILYVRAPWWVRERWRRTCARYIRLTGFRPRMLSR